MALRELSIRNFAIIKTLEIELEDGLTVITGETGAGKSIVVGALSLLLGSRADSNMIRHREDQCDIAALFDITELKSVKAWLEQRDLQQEETNNRCYCLVRRIVRIDKPTKCYINDQPTTLTSLKELGSLLVDLHGQHEHQSLLRRTAQRQILDDFAGHAEDLKKLAVLSAKIHRTDRELRQVLNQNSDTADRIDLLAFQLTELEEANLIEGEFAELELEQARLSNSGELRNGIQHAIDALHLNENQNVSTLLGQQIHQLQSFADVDPSLSPVVEQLNNALSQIDDGRASLEQSLSQVESNPERLLDVDARMQLLVNLARKHRSSESELITKHETVKEEYNRLTQLHNAPDQLKAKLTELQTEYLNIAKRVSSERRIVAQRLSESITEQMQDLGMAGGVFTIQITAQSEVRYAEHGMDNIEYLVSTNNGAPQLPLNKTASGGELSRISLAIQVITSQLASTPCMVFDEVDVGVGGKVAGIVGERLQALGEHAQVICITHLPQVAALGAQHFAVDKVSSSYETYSTLLQLEPEQRLEEVARMLGGKEITQQTRAHAAEMLNQTQRINTSQQALS